MFLIFALKRWEIFASSSFLRYDLLKLKTDPLHTPLKLAYYLNVFNPDTYEAFSSSSRLITGFPSSKNKEVEKINIGDKFICYLTKLSRWIGVLEVSSEFFRDDSPIFLPQNDPFCLRFKVTPRVWLEKQLGIPMHEPKVWDNLSFTRGMSHQSSNWTMKLRNCPNHLNDQDGILLENILYEQSGKQEIFELKPKDNKIVKNRFQSLKNLQPDTAKPIIQEPIYKPEESSNIAEARESIKIQALIASIGAEMGFSIWVPRQDRNAVLKYWSNKKSVLLETLPLNYEGETLKTIEQIDILWLSQRSIIRAFEVEHTTSIYSGILRMADLLALQPNMNIKLHIVSPKERKDKVFHEIQRPVFSVLPMALAKQCTYLSYESIKELSEQKHLSHFSDSVLDEYIEKVK